MFDRYITMPISEYSELIDHRLEKLLEFFNERKPQLEKEAEKILLDEFNESWFGLKKYFYKPKCGKDLIDDYVNSLDWFENLIEPLYLIDVYQKQIDSLKKQQCIYSNTVSNALITISCSEYNFLK